METKRLIETENSIQEFTVQFYGGTVMIEQNQLPLGQISCELLDHPVEELLALHDDCLLYTSISSLFKSFQPSRSGFLILHEYSHQSWQAAGKPPLSCW